MPRSAARLSQDSLISPYSSMNALQPCTLKDLRVWDHVLAGDAKQSAQAIDVESV